MRERRWNDFLLAAQGSSGIITGVVNAIQINILNFVYMKVAHALNNWGALRRHAAGVLPARELARM